MKRISIAVILMLVLAACGLPSGGDPSGGYNGDPSDGGYYTVSGQIVRRDTGEPYPNAYVRFGWLVNASHENEIDTVTDDSGRYAIQIPAGQYRVSAGDPCDLSAGFDIVRGARDAMITVPGTSEVDFVEYPIGGSVEGDPWCR